MCMYGIIQYNIYCYIRDLQHQVNVSTNITFIIYKLMPNVTVCMI